MLGLYIPRYEDLWFRKLFMADEETMSYNHASGGTIDFPEEQWRNWYRRWLTDAGNERFYRYLIDANGTFVGEVAYRFDAAEDRYIANVIVYSEYRGNGYGRDGLELLCEAAKQNGLTELCDAIAIDNPAIGLFLACGFTEEFRTEEMIMVKKQL